MKKSFSFYFFKITVFTLALGAVFPEKKLFKSRIGVFLLYKVWPLVIVSVWLPLIPMVVMKMWQYLGTGSWDELLDILHMFFVGVFSMYMMCVVQITAKNYQNTMRILEEDFRTNNDSTVKEFFMVLILWSGIPVCFLLFIGGCVYYKENLVPLWVPFIDNEKELSSKVFYGIWVYEMCFAPFIFITLTIWGPFIIVSTVCICKELQYLSNAVNFYGYKYVEDGYVKRMKECWRFSKRDPETEMISETLRDSPDMVRFTRKVIDHHLTIRSAIYNVSRINSYVFQVQTIAAVVHSCFLAFNLYYTTHVEKVMLKSSPILFFSYYLIYAYCWNGEQLTRKNEELVTTMYRFPWYKCPHSYKKSMLVMMEFLRQPVCLSGDGIVSATFATFLSCCQQSVSYILVLKALTPEKGKIFLGEGLHDNFTTLSTANGSWLESVG